MQCRCSSGRRRGTGRYVTEGPKKFKRAVETAFQDGATAKGPSSSPRSGPRGRTTRKCFEEQAAAGGDPAAVSFFGKSGGTCIYCAKRRAEM